MTSPYDGLSVGEWEAKTHELIATHPIDPDELYEIVRKSWRDIFESEIGSKPFRIGQDLFPRPQIMGFFLHELIPLELEYRYPKLWRKDQTTEEKDLVYIPDADYSIEIKTSSSAKSIYGNRNYAQKSQSSKKSKSGYYLAINFEKFSKKQNHPQIKLVRFGWLGHDNWQGQIAATGQQARLSPHVEQYKLLKLPLK